MNGKTHLVGKTSPKSVRHWSAKAEQLRVLLMSPSSKAPSTRAAEAVHSPSSFPPVQIVLNLSIMELAIDSGALPLALRVGGQVVEAKHTARILSCAC